MTDKKEPLVMSTETFAQILEAQYRRDLEQQPASWSVSPALGRKISEDGRMQDFFGATTVLKLSQEDKARCRIVQGKLFDGLGLPLVPILPVTFHVTVHALSNPYSVPGGTPDAVLADMERKRESVSGLFRTIRSLYAGRRIRLRTLGPSTNAKDVVSIKLAPIGGEDAELLTDLFGRLEELHPLGKPYVPHVSLAYFLPRLYSGSQIAALYDRLRVLDQEAGRFELTLDILDMAYQHHYHMNDFRDEFTVRDV